MADATDKKEGTTDNSNPSDETTDEGTEEKSANANLTSPEGILMLCIAGLLDGIGFIIFILGTWFAIDDYGILDAVGLAIIGGWVFFRSGFNKDVVKKGLRRFITTSMIEIFPFLGGASPTLIYFFF